MTQTFVDHYSSSPYATFPQSVRTGGSLPISFIRSEQEAHDFVDPAIPELVVVQALRADMPFRWNLGDGWASARFRSNDLSLCPARTAIDYECGGEHEVLGMILPIGTVETLLERESGAASSAVLEPLAARTVFRDETVRAAMLEMWAECARDDPAARLLVDGLVNVVLGRLLRLAGAPLENETYRLDPTTLARIDEYVHAHLGQRIGVDELATLAGMSRFRFARSFPATTGVSPYQYVTRRRAERARDMIERGDLPLVDVALACGYASQSHMNAVFRRHLGTTPGRCRKG